MTKLIVDLFESIDIENDHPQVLSRLRIVGRLDCKLIEESRPSATIEQSGKRVAERCLVRIEQFALQLFVF